MAHARARATGEPLAYLMGYRDFWSLRLIVDQHVLIPRRETEHLVEWALECLDTGEQRVLDLGTAVAPSHWLANQSGLTCPLLAWIKASKPWLVPGETVRH